MDLRTEVYVIICIRCVPIVFHSIGVYLLFSVNYLKKCNTTQGVYILWLSIIEITLNIGKILIRSMSEKSQATYIMDVIRTGVIACQLVTVLSAMTIDRAAFVILNIRYHTIWEPRKILKWLIAFSCVSSCCVTTILWFTSVNEVDFLYIKHVFFWPITDTVNVTVIIVCYSLVTHKVRQQSKRLLRKQNLELYKKRISELTKVPKLIVSTYIVFWVSMNQVVMVFELLGKTISPTWDIVINVFVCTSYSLDAVFYTYFCRPVRKMMCKKLTRFYRSSRKNTVCIQ